MSNPKDKNILLRTIERERLARKEAERLLENKSRDLFYANQQLQEANEELKKQQSLVVHQEKMASVGQLSAGIAHEINNPIGYIANNLGILKDYIETFINMVQDIEKELKSDSVNFARLQDLMNSEDVFEDLKDGICLIDESIEGSERVKNIIGNLKNFIHTNDELEMKKININDGIESTIKIANHSTADKLSIHTELGELPEISCFAGQLNQIFMNLIINAADAMEKSGHLTIRTSIENSYVLIVFEDDGPGIEEDVLNKIFDPFFTTKEIGKGTGLGLSITHQIIERHEGTISVSSKVGEGTKFEITLPIKSQNDK